MDGRVTKIRRFETTLLEAYVFVIKLKCRFPDAYFTFIGQTLPPGRRVLGDEGVVGGAWLLTLKMKHISVGNNCTSLAEKRKPITNDGSQSPWAHLFAQGTVSWYVCVCVWRGGDVVSVVMRVKCR